MPDTETTDQQVDAAIQRADALQKRWAAINTDYRKSLMLLTEGVRSTLASSDLPNNDVLATIDKSLGWMRDIVNQHKKIIKPNGEKP